MAKPALFCSWSLCAPLQSPSSTSPGRSAPCGPQWLCSSAGSAAAQTMCHAHACTGPNACLTIEHCSQIKSKFAKSLIPVPAPSSPPSFQSNHSKAASYPECPCLQRCVSVSAFPSRNLFKHLKRDPPHSDEVRANSGIDILNLGCQVVHFQEDSGGLPSTVVHHRKGQFSVHVDLQNDKIERLLFPGYASIT